jgi:hypothetical protein
LESQGTKCLSCSKVEEEKKPRITAEEAEAHIDPFPAGTRPSTSALPTIETPKKKKSEYISIQDPPLGAC